MWKMRAETFPHPVADREKAGALGVPVWSEDDLDRAIGGGR